MYPLPKNRNLYYKNLKSKGMVNFMSNLDVLSSLDNLWRMSQEDSLSEYNWLSDDKNIYLEILMPGLNADEIEISVTQRWTIVIVGEGLKGSTFNKELCFALPDDPSIDSDGIVAVLSNGILVITFPKIDSPPLRKIIVQNI